MVKKTSTQFENYLITKRKLVNGHFEKLLNEEVDREIQNYEIDDTCKLDKFKESLKYTVMAGGKRVRPIMTIAVYELFRNDLAEVIGPACALELIHAASLMLDDLPCMDNATYRRGKKAHHLVYGDSTTILASAALWVASFKIFSDIKSIKINAIVKETAEAIGYAGLIRGQYIDLESFRQPSTIEELNECYYLKTGLLFQTAVKIGALLGQANKSQLEILEKFGKVFGLAYQIRDDILDTEATLDQRGKDVGLDQKNTKPTYVSLLGNKRAKRELVKVINSATGELKKLNLEVDMLISLANFLKLK